MSDLIGGVTDAKGADLTGTGVQSAGHLGSLVRLPLPASAPSRGLRRALLGIDSIAALITWAVPFSLPGSAIYRATYRTTDRGVGWLSVVGVIAGLALAVAVTLAVLATHRLYLSRVCSMRTVEIARLGRSALVLAAVALVAARLLSDVHLGRDTAGVGAGAFVWLNVGRTGFAGWLGKARRRGRFVRPVLLIGTNEEAAALAHLIGDHPQLGFRVVAVVGDATEARRLELSAPWIGTIDEVPVLLEHAPLTGALVVGSALERRQLNATIRTLLRKQVHVHLSTGVHGIDHRRLRSYSLAYEPMLYVEQAKLEGWQEVVKRLLDVTIGSVVLVSASPMLAIAALFIKAADGGPVLFRQTRVGRNGELFTMYKLRTMVPQAEDHIIDLVAANVRHGPLFKMARDPRVTHIGQFLRATSIDELPQLMNVLRGSMSLVGPRPALPSEAACFDDDLLARHDVPPGITGLWQVEGRDDPRFSLYQRLDLFYVENWSVVLDLAILTVTAKVVVVRAWHALRGRIVVN